MDGNRRWAQQRGWNPWYGHKEGIEAINRVIDFCMQHAIQHLSLFVFAVQNFKRSKCEINALFDMLINQQQINSMLALCREKKIRVRIIGDQALFPVSVIPFFQKMEKETMMNNGLRLYFNFCYGGQEEIVAGVRHIMKKIQSGEMQVQDISSQTFSACLWTKGIPDPDLIIRTGGVRRLSNYFLFQAAYSEFYFLDCLWPDITSENLEKAVAYYNTCKRNFGV
jgi:undecaprenyl diphosphate synthase